MLPADQPLLYRIDFPVVIYALHENAAFKACAFCSGVDIELVPGDLFRVKKLLSLVGALRTVGKAQGAVARTGLFAHILLPDCQKAGRSLGILKPNLLHIEDNR